MNAFSASAPGVQSKSLSIAVADDVPEIQALASTWLTALGHTVVCAENGSELLRIVGTRPVDVVITDVMMPEKDGFEVIRALKGSFPNVKIISISGGADVMPKSDCLRVAKALGADVVVAKPFNRAQLLGALDSLALG